MSALTLLGWALTRPIALAGILLPVVIVLLSFRRQRPRTVVIGTSRFFEKGEGAAFARRRRRLSGARWAAIVALLLGTLAAAGPRPEAGSEPPEIFVVQVDRTPSMYLPVDATRPDGERRIDVALRAARDWLRERDRGPVDVLVRWADASAGTFELPLAVAVDAPPPDWVTSAPVRPGAEPVWGGLDRPGALFVTDAVPAGERRIAGLFTSGGSAVPGPVSIGAGGLLEWTGDDLAPLRPGDGSRRLTVRIDTSVPEKVEAFARLWATERGVEIVGSGAPPDLVIRGPGRGAEAAQLAGGRDGWSSQFWAPGSGLLDEGCEPWLVAENGTPLVGVRRGTVVLYFSGMLTEPTDAAAFAVSWAGLFDDALLTPPDVVSIDERRPAGAARVAAPDLMRLGGPAADVDAARRARLGRRAELTLTVAAALAGLLALALRARGSR